MSARGPEKKRRPASSGEAGKDILDHLEEFIETRVQKNLRKGFEEIEGFLRREFLERDREGARGGKKDAGLFSYMEAFLEDKQVAAVIPSTKFLVERVLKRIEWPAARVLVEYGPAEGVMTRAFLERLPSDGLLVAVETNARFVETLGRLRDPRLQVIHGSVLDIDRLLAPLSLPPADAVASGIPFSFLKPIERHQLLHKTEALLRPGGRFVAYQVTTHLVPLMKYHFRTVDAQLELRNLPPHFVFTGTK